MGVGAVRVLDGETAFLLGVDCFATDAAVLAAVFDLVDALTIALAGPAREEDCG